MVSIVTFRSVFQNVVTYMHFSLQNMNFNFGHDFETVNTHRYYNFQEEQVDSLLSKNWAVKS